MENYDEIIQSLTRRVYHLEQEVIKLGGEAYNKQKSNSLEIEDDSVKNQAYPIDSENKTAADNERTAENEIKNIQPHGPLQDNFSNDLHDGISEKKSSVKRDVHKKQNMENKIGKNLMGILASVLIFFSLILFTGIAFNYISDLAKVIIMFAISIAIAVLGIVKMPRKNSDKELKYKTFYTTLAACGVGAVYITDLVAYFGFHCISLVPFIISLVIWILITMVLAYKCSDIFVYICNIGLVIATFLTAVQFDSSLLGFVIYTICLIALYLINRHEDFNKDCFYFIQYPVIFICLTFAVDTSVFNFVIFTLLLAVVFVLANALYEISSRQIITNLITSILNIIALIRVCVGINNDVMSCISIGLLLAIMALYFIRYYKSKPGLFYTIYIITYFISVCVFLTTDLYILIALTPFILFLLVGFALKDMVVRIGGYIAFFASFMVHMNFYQSWFVVAIYLLLFVIVAFAVYLIQYSIVDKYILTAILLIAFANIVNTFEINNCISFAIFGLIALIMNLSAYIINPKTKEKEFSSEIVGYIICGFMILFGLTNMLGRELTPEIYQVIIISLITLVLCVINTRKLYATHIPEMLVGFYLCIKFSIWIFAILLRLEAASYIVSIVGILISIFCIVLGFSIKQKAFRLYGLVLSMVSVIKLILFDISYDSNILRPVGFFIAGVLCFAISFIYSKLEKNIVAEEKTEKEELQAWEREE